MSQKIVHFQDGSYIKLHVESAKSHIGDIEKLTILKHGPFKQNHCGTIITEAVGRHACDLYWTLRVVRNRVQVTVTCLVFNNLILEFFMNQNLNLHLKEELCDTDLTGVLALNFSHLLFQRTICHSFPCDREVDAQWVCRQVHQEKEAGVLSEGCGQGGHPEGDPHSSGDGACKHHLPTPGLRKRPASHPRIGTVSIIIFTFSLAPLVRKKGWLKIRTNSLCFIFDWSHFVKVSCVPKVLGNIWNHSVENEIFGKYLSTGIS